MKNIVRRISALVIIVSFFLPWLALLGLTATGFDLIKYSIKFGKNFGEDALVFTGILVLSIFILAVITLIIPHFIPAIILLILTGVFAVMAFDSDMDLFRATGMIVSFVGALGVLISFFLKKKPKKDEVSQTTEQGDEIVSEQEPSVTVESEEVAKSEISAEVKEMPEPEVPTASQEALEVAVTTEVKEAVDPEVTTEGKKADELETTADVQETPDAEVPVENKETPHTEVPTVSDETPEADVLTTSKETPKPEATTEVGEGAEVEVAPEVLETPETEGLVKQFCSNCGERIGPEPKFCPLCGEEVK